MRLVDISEQMVRSLIALSLLCLWSVCVRAEVETNTALNTWPVSNFSERGLQDWEEKSFVDSTHYEVVTLDQQVVLKAVTDRSASALYRELDIDLKARPFLNWSWRVENIYPIQDQKQKSGDDFAARIYVVVRVGIFPWQTRALNYVWSNKEETESYWPNPFTAKAIMIPVRAGDSGLGQWHRQRVNVREDYYRIFSEHLDQAHGISIMSDSDNAAGSAVAYYGDIYFSD